MLNVNAALHSSLQKTNQHIVRSKQQLHSMTSSSNCQGLILISLIDIYITKKETVITIE